MQLQGKRILVAGLLNRRSIAHAIGAACAAEGAEVCFTCVGEAVAERARPLAQELGASVLSCDVASDEALRGLSDTLAGRWGRVDGVVHSVAFAPLAAAGADVGGCGREAFRVAHDISAYSFIGLAGALRGLLAPDAALLTMSFLGSRRAIPNYGVMGVAKAALESAVRYLAAELGPAGVRVNAIAAGPMRTASSLAIARFPESLGFIERESPLRRNVRAEEIARPSVFLLSPAASAITGVVLDVDCGMHAIMPGLVSHDLFAGAAA